MSVVVWIGLGVVYEEINARWAEYRMYGRSGGCREAIVLRRYVRANLILFCQ